MSRTNNVDLTCADIKEQREVLSRSQNCSCFNYGIQCCKNICQMSQIKSMVELIGIPPDDFNQKVRLSPSKYSSQNCHEFSVRSHESANSKAIHNNNKYRVHSQDETTPLHLIVGSKKHCKGRKRSQDGKCRTLPEMAEQKQNQKRSPDITKRQNLGINYIENCNASKGRLDAGAGSSGRNRRHSGRVRSASRERTRVEEIRLGYQKLQAAIPAVPKNTKLAKLEILVLATAYIAHLTQLLKGVENEEEGKTKSEQEGQERDEQHEPRESVRGKSTAATPTAFSQPAASCQHSTTAPVTAKKTGKRWPMRDRLYVAVGASPPDQSCNCTPNAHHRAAATAQRRVAMRHADQQGKMHFNIPLEKVDTDRNFDSFDKEDNKWTYRNENHFRCAHKEPVYETCPQNFTVYSPQPHHNLSAYGCTKEPVYGTCMYGPVEATSYEGGSHLPAVNITRSRSGIISSSYHSESLAETEMSFNACTFGLVKSGTKTHDVPKFYEEMTTLPGL